MKTAVFFVSLCLVIFTQIGCQKEEPETRENILSQGFLLMDQGRWDDAISYFKEVLEKDDHYHVKLALASAYAGRAGIKIEQIYSFTAVKDVPAPDVQGADATKAAGANKQTSVLLGSLGKYQEHWNKIPDVTESARTDLGAGIKVLEKDPVPGVRLYSAVLRIVLLKSAIKEGVEDFNKNVAGSKKVCAQDLKPYVNWSGKVLESVKTLTLDLEVAFPEQKQNYADIREKIELAVGQASGLVLMAGNKCF